MACCAFAVLLLFNLLAPLGLFWNRNHPGSNRNAAAWRNAGQALAPAPESFLRGWKPPATVLAAVVATQFALLAVAYASLHQHDVQPPAAPISAGQWDAFAALHTVWCLDETGTAVGLPGE